MSMDAPQTAQQYAESTGKKWKSVQRQLTRKGLPSAAGQMLTDEIRAVIDGKKTPVTKTKTVKAVTVTSDKVAVLSPCVQYVPTETKTADTIQVKIKSTSGQNTTNDKAKETKTAEWWWVVSVCFFVSFLSVCLTTLGLALFAQWAGYILGGMFALSLLAAVIVARNKMKGDTSEQALNTVLYMEIGACCLHLFTFYSLLPEMDFWLRGCAALPMAAFAGFLSYQAVKLVRLYNAET